MLDTWTVSLPVDFRNDNNMLNTNEEFIAKGIFGFRVL